MRFKGVEKKLFLITLTVALAASVFTLWSCGKAADATLDGTEAGSSVETGTEKGGDVPQTDAGTENLVNINPDSGYGELHAEKVGFIDKKSFRLHPSGLVYEEDGKYGIITLEADHDTGAVYLYCVPTNNVINDSTITDNNNYFTVVRADRTWSDDPSLNPFFLVNERGEPVMPGEYGFFEILNGRYVRVFTLTGTTDSEEEALVKFNSGITTAIGVFDGDVLYKGKWEIYDLKEAALVDGVGGTTNSRVEAHGPYIEFRSDDGKWLTVDPDGNAPDGELIEFDRNSDSFCAVENETVGKVLSASGETLFSYDPNEFKVIKRTPDGSFVAEKEEGGERYRFVVDEKGEKISADYKGSISLCGRFVLCDGSVYDLDGNVVIRGEFGSIRTDYLKNAVWLAVPYASTDKSDIYTFYDANGKELLSGTEESFQTSNLTAYKTGDKTMYYSLVDGDFTVEGRGSEIPLTVITKSEKEEELYDLFDLRSNKIIISGNKQYETSAKYYRTDGRYYVYAEKADGGYDVYRVE